MFSDLVVMNATSSNGVVILVSNGAISQYSYIFLDTMLSKLRISGSLINATLQIKANVSLDSNFSSTSTNYLFYNLSTSSVVLPSGTNFVATAITQSPEVGKPYTFKVAMDVSCNRTAPTVKVNGVALSAVSGENGIFTFAIQNLRGAESIVITPVINTYTITITPIGNIPSGYSTQTFICNYGDSIYYSSTDLYKNSGGKGEKVYVGSNGRYSVSSYSCDSVTMASSKEYVVTSDMSIQAYWQYSGGTSSIN